jgi:hypothetical protein
MYNVTRGQIASTKKVMKFVEYVSVLARLRCDLETERFDCTLRFLSPVRPQTLIASGQLGYCSFPQPWSKERHKNH